jgi:hypothetical protein
MGAWAEVTQRKAHWVDVHGLMEELLDQLRIASFSRFTGVMEDIEKKYSILNNIVLVSTIFSERCA